MPQDQAARKDISNPAKLLRALIHATGITDCKQLSEMLAIPVRTLQRLKLEVAEAVDTATANDAKHAISGAATSAISGVSSANDAISGASGASRAHASKENPTGLVITSVVQKDSSNEESQKPTPALALQAFEAYNAAALRCALPQAVRLTKDRQRKLTARLKEHGLDGWSKALVNLEASKFLRGENNRGWRANLDFLLQPESFNKLLDGSYAGQQSAKPKPTASAAPPTSYHEHDRAVADISKRLLDQALSGSRL